MNDHQIEYSVNIFEDKREIKNLMGKYVASLLLRRDNKFFTSFWSQTQEDVCYSTNEGYYLGSDSINKYYSSVRKKHEICSSIIRDLFPQQLGKLTDDEVYGVGTLEMKPLQSAYICVAKDRKTAKGLWTVNGNSAVITESGPTARWTWGFFAADFILEESEWKIWHLQYLEDINTQAGTNWATAHEDWPKRPEFSAVSAFKMPEPDIRTALREHYSPDRPFTPTPRIPEPYDTFSETFSYGYGGAIK